MILNSLLNHSALMLVVLSMLVLAAYGVGMGLKFGLRQARRLFTHSV